ncbi:MAG: alpha/beta fold hydrolase [Pseudomonadota bacterium]
MALSTHYRLMWSLFLSRWSRLTPGVALIIFPLIALALAGCTPDFRPMGPAIQEPRLNDEAIIAADGARLPFRVWPAMGEPRAIVLALHGFTDYSQAFALPAPAWSTVGITTYAFDQRGFGEAEPIGRWAGADTYRADTLAALAILADRHPDTPLFLLGESMGGSIAILAATYPGPPKPYNTELLILPDPEPRPPVADGMILIAPGILDRPSLSSTERAFLDIGVNLLPWAMSGRRGVAVLPTDNLALLRAMGKDPLMQREVRFDQVYGLLGTLEAATQQVPNIDLPTLVLFGGQDEILPPKAAEYFAQQTFAQMARGVVETEIIPEAYHMILRDRAAAARHERVGAWILERAQALNNP